MTKLRAVVRRRWLVLLLGVALGALAGALSAVVAPEADDSERFSVSQLIVANSAAPQPGGVEQDALRVTRGEVARAAAATLGEQDPADAASRVSASADSDTGSIEVTSTSTDPELATARVQAFVDAFLDVVNGSLVAEQERRFSELQEQLDQATAELSAFDAANPPSSLVGPTANPILASQRSTLQQNVESAERQLRDERLNARQSLPYSTLGPDAPEAVDNDLIPVPTGLPFRVALLGLVGLALAIAVVIVVERLVPRIDTRDELVAAVDLPVLAEVGYFRHRKIPRASDGTLRLEGAWAEPYRRIRSAVQFVQAGHDDGRESHVFMFTSPSPSEGKSTTTAVTALALAEAGQRTLVVGGDFRKPSVHTLLGVGSTPGIREHARLDIDRPSTDQIVHSTSHADLYVAPSGAPGKEVAGMADATRELIHEAVAQGATVVVDTSPVEVANDAIDLLSAVDQVIVVVRSGRTSRRALLHTIEQLRQHGASIMGTTLIGTPGLAKQQYYYEGYYAEAGAKGSDLFRSAGSGPPGGGAQSRPAASSEPGPAATPGSEPAASAEPEPGASSGSEPAASPQPSADPTPTDRVGVWAIAPPDAAPPPYRGSAADPFR
jgi:capsular exopolysaccharide synthesis family protein